MFIIPASMLQSVLSPLALLGMLGPPPGADTLLVNCWLICAIDVIGSKPLPPIPPVDDGVDGFNGVFSGTGPDAPLM